MEKGLNLVSVHHVAMYKQRLYLKILAIMRVVTLGTFTIHGENKVKILNVWSLREMIIVRVSWTRLMQIVKKTTKANKTGMVNKLTTQPVKPKTGPLNQLLKLKIGPPKPVLVTRTGLKLTPDKVGKLKKQFLIFNAKFIF